MNHDDFQQLPRKARFALRWEHARAQWNWRAIGIACAALLASSTISVLGGAALVGMKAEDLMMHRIDMDDPNMAALEAYAKLSKPEIADKLSEAESEAVSLGEHQIWIEDSIFTKLFTSKLGIDGRSSATSIPGLPSISHWFEESAKLGTLAKKAAGPPVACAWLPAVLGSLPWSDELPHEPCGMAHHRAFVWGAPLLLETLMMVIMCLVMMNMAEEDDKDQSPLDILRPKRSFVAWLETDGASALSRWEQRLILPAAPPSRQNQTPRL